MTTFLALLRGINVGGNNKIAMSDLRELLSALGHGEVRTYIQSGNALFSSDDADSDRVAAAIEERISADLGLRIRCVLRSRAELSDVVDRYPLAGIATNPSRTFVTFLSAVPDGDRLARVDPEAYAPDVFRVSGREIYQWFPEGSHQSKLTNAFWEKTIGLTGTARNWNTVTKLLTMADLLP